MYVRCKQGCQSLFSEERVSLPSPSEDSLPYLEGRDEGGTYSEAEGVPLEGSDAKTSEGRHTDPEDPLPDLPF